MNGRARVEITDAIKGVGINCKVPADQKSHISNLVHYCKDKGEQRPLLDISMSVRATLSEAYAGNLVFSFIENPLLRVETVKHRRTSSQNSTLRGIERFIYIAENGEEPTKEDMYWIHEGLLEQFSIWVTNPRTGVSLPKRTSDPSMSTTEMARIVHGALNTLSLISIPDEIMKLIGNDMKNLWEGWYKWRYEQKKDPLQELEAAMDWPRYKENHPVCELCALAGVDPDPIERMHIISAGADESIYEMPWNWLAAHRSHHTLQHSEGWGIIEKSYPHIVGKLKRARIMQGEKK